MIKNLKLKIKNSQKGVSLIISFLIMTIMLASVLGFSTILFNKIKTLGNVGNSVSSFYAAESGIEKTLYFDRKQKTGKRGLCDICNKCSDCADCVLKAFSANGCNINTCNNCEASYNSTFNGKIYFVEARVSPNLFFSCSSKGDYKDTTKTIGVTADSILAVPKEQ